MDVGGEVGLALYLPYTGVDGWEESGRYVGYGGGEVRCFRLYMCVLVALGAVAEEG